MGGGACVTSETQTSKTTEPRSFLLPCTSVRPPPASCQQTAAVTSACSCAPHFTALTRSSQEGKINDSRVYQFSFLPPLRRTRDEQEKWRRRVPWWPSHQEAKCQLAGRLEGEQQRWEGGRERERGRRSLLDSVTIDRCVLTLPRLFSVSPV